MIRFPVENMSLVALFVFQLAKLHIFKEKHNKMISFFEVDEVNEVGCPFCNLFFHKDYVSLSLPKGLAQQSVRISPPLEGRGWGGVFD